MAKALAKSILETDAAANRPETRLRAPGIHRRRIVLGVWLESGR